MPKTTQMRACPEGSQHSSAYISPRFYSTLLQRAEPSPLPLAKSKTQLIVIADICHKASVHHLLTDLDQHHGTILRTLWVVQRLALLLRVLKTAVIDAGDSSMVKCSTYKPKELSLDL